MPRSRLLAVALLLAACKSRPAPAVPSPTPAPGGGVTDEALHAAAERSDEIPRARLLPMLKSRASIEATLARVPEAQRGSLTVPMQPIAGDNGVAVSWQVVRALFAALFEAVLLAPLALGLAALSAKRARALFVGTVAATWAATVCWLVVGWPLSLQLAGCTGLVNPPWAFVLLPASAAVGAALGWLVWRQARGAAVSLLLTIAFLLLLLPAIFVAHVGTWTQAAQAGGRCRKGNVTQGLSSATAAMLPDPLP